MANKERYAFLKRVLDLLFSLILIVMLSLPMLFIYILVALTSSGGGIFRQRRVGMNGKYFWCYKFRTMYKYAPSEMPTSKFTSASEYITPIGAILRKSSMDELPQLFNVLKGDMSLVGPRPLIISEGDIHNYRKRCGVYAIRPGITGLAQINGRNDIDDDVKLKFDVKYLRNMSLIEDTKIIFQTVFGGLFG